MPTKAEPDTIGGVEQLTPDNPPPSVDDRSVPQFDEAHEAKQRAATIGERRRSFFSDSADEAPARPRPARPPKPAGKPAQKNAPQATDEGAADHRRVLFTDYMTEEEVGEHAERLVEELDEGEGTEPAEPEEAAGEPAEAETEAGEPQPEAQPGAQEIEFRNADGMRYRVRRPDGKYSDLSALSGHHIEVPFNGEYRAVPADKVPNLLGLGLLYSQKSQAIRQAEEQIEQERYRLHQAAQQLQQERDEIDRYWSDPEYRALVEREREYMETPEGRAQAERRRNERLQEQIAERDRREARDLVYNQQIAPAFEQLVKENPLVKPEKIGKLLKAAMAEFGHRDLELRRTERGWVPVNWPAWNRFQKLLREDWPAEVRAEQAELAELVGKQKKQSDDEVRKAKAEAEAAMTKAELARNAAASKVPSTPGLAPSRERPRQRITTIQQGRAWLRGED